MRTSNLLSAVAIVLAVAACAWACELSPDDVGTNDFENPTARAPGAGDISGCLDFANGDVSDAFLFETAGDYFFYLGAENGDVLTVTLCTEYLEDAGTVSCGSFTEPVTIPNDGTYTAISFTVDPAFPTVMDIESVSTGALSGSTAWVATTVLPPTTCDVETTKDATFVAVITADTFNYDGCLNWPVDTIDGYYMTTVGNYALVISNGGDSPLNWELCISSDGTTCDTSVDSSTMSALSIDSLNFEVTASNSYLLLLTPMMTDDSLASYNLIATSPCGDFEPSNQLAPIEVTAVNPTLRGCVTFSTDNVDGYQFQADASHSLELTNWGSQPLSYNLCFSSSVGAGCDGATITSGDLSSFGATTLLTFTPTASDDVLLVLVPNTAVEGSVIPYEIAPPSTGASDDPHFVGLRGQHYDVHGKNDAIYNIVSSEHIQVNALFHHYDTTKLLNYSTWFTQFGIVAIDEDDSSKAHSVLISVDDSGKTSVQMADVSIDIGEVWPMCHVMLSERDEKAAAEIRNAAAANEEEPLSLDRGHQYLFRQDEYTVLVNTTLFQFAFSINPVGHEEFCSNGCPHIDFTVTPNVDMDVLEAKNVGGLLGSTWRDNLRNVMDTQTLSVWFEERVSTFNVNGIFSRV